MKLLDLFCGAGGAAHGYNLAGFEILGVDIHPQPNYPFDFVQADALQLKHLSKDFDLIHASPPCQRFSTASGKLDRTHHPDLLRPCRELLKSFHKPYVIENVEGAPLKNPLKLCGTLFSELRVLRHRVFEASFPIPQPDLKNFCYNHPPVYSKNNSHLDPYKSYVTVAGGGNCPKDAAQTAMGIDWYTTQKELSQAIPPAYTEYIGKFARTYLS